MALTRYVPDRGDIVWLTFDPQAGHEQAGRRPALIVSPIEYNRKSQMALVCPITNRSKGYVFEVALPVDLAVSGVILSDQLKNVDCRARSASFVCRAPDDVVLEVLDKISLLVSP